MKCPHTCPACHSNDLEMLLDMGDQPMSLIALQSDPQRSRELVCHPIKMLICRNCTHVFNGEYDDDNVKYTAEGCRMFNTGSGWQEHIADVYRLLAPIVKDESLDLIIEIGAGDCEFLAGIDTEAKRIAVDPCEAVYAAERHGIVFYREHFDPVKHIPKAGNTLIIMRHLLEHFERPRDILEGLARATKARSHPTILYIEVPSCENALRRCRIEDWTYEHPQHFTVNSMRALLRASGLDHFIVLPKCDGEVLSVIVKIEPAKHHDNDLCVETILMDYERLAQNIRCSLGWVRHLAIDSAVFWGGAGKSAMFIRQFRLPEDDTIVVDSHKAKWGLYVPGTGIKIQSPSILYGQQPDYIIATTSWRANDIRDEIVRDDIPCKTLLKFEGGEMREVPLGR